MTIVIFTYVNGHLNEDLQLERQIETYYNRKHSFKIDQQVASSCKRQRNAENARVNKMSEPGLKKVYF